jgi:hypothetical protein
MEQTQTKAHGAHIWIVHFPDLAGPEIDALSTALESIADGAAVTEKEAGLYSRRWIRHVGSTVRLV